MVTVFISCICRFINNFTIGVETQIFITMARRVGPKKIQGYC